MLVHQNHHCQLYNFCLRSSLSAACPPASLGSVFALCEVRIFLVMRILCEVRISFEMRIFCEVKSFQWLNISQAALALLHLVQYPILFEACPRSSLGSRSAWRWNHVLSGGYIPSTTCPQSCRQCHLQRQPLRRFVVSEWQQLDIRLDAQVASWALGLWWRLVRFSSSFPSLLFSSSTIQPASILQNIDSYNSHLWRSFQTSSKMLILKLSTFSQCFVHGHWRLSLQKTNCGKRNSLLKVG